MTDAPQPSPPAATAPAPGQKRLFAACALALFGLGITIIHFAWPSPLMFTLFMTLGQSSLGLAMAIYATIIFGDLRRQKVL